MYGTAYPGTAGYISNDDHDGCGQQKLASDAAATATFPRHQGLVRHE